MNKLLLSTIITFILSLFGINSFFTTQNETSKEESRWVEHTQKVIIETKDFLSAIQDAETGQRGYLLTSNPAYLEPYDLGIVKAKQSLETLKELTSDNASQQTKLNLIEKQMNLKFQELKTTINLTRNNKAIKLVKQDIGKQYMDELRTLIQGFENTESLLLQQRQEKFSAHQNNYTNLIKIFLTVALFIIFYFLYSSLNQKNIVLLQNNLLEEKSKKLLNQYNLMQHIINSVPARIFWKDKEGTYLGANKLFLQDAQLESADEIIGKNDFEMPWGKTEGQLYRDDDLSIMNSGNSKLNFEETQTDDKGNIISVLTSKVPLEDEHGKIIGLLGTYTDISKQRNTENELIELNKSLDERVKKAVQANKEKDIKMLRVAEEKNKELKKAQSDLSNQLNITKTIINSVPIRIFWKDKDGIYLGANQLFIDDAELNNESDIIGKSDFEMTWRESAQQFIEDDAGVVNSGVPRLNYEEVQPKEDGSAIHIRTSKVPLVDSNNNTLGILGIYDDITESKKMEVDLQEANKEINKHLELFSNNVIASNSDLKGNITYASQALCNISGYSQSELIGQPHCILKSNETPKVIFEDLWRTITSGKTWTGELKNNIKNGGFYWVRATIYPEFDSSNTLIGYRSIRQNITAEKAKEQFLANMSHELRTPLNAIVGFIEIIKNKTKEDYTRDYAKVIDKASKGLLHIIEDILDFSKIESGKIDIDKIDFNIRDEFESILNLFDATASSNDITLSLDIDNNLPIHINTDPYRIKQVVSNLLSNAIKFTDKGKNIFIKISYSDENLKVSVKDEGKGISDNKLSHIFEAFSQEDTSTTREFGGTGLGLSISSELIKLLGGELKVKSELGIGSEFYFEIPIELGEASIPENVEDVFINKNKTFKVLLAEDNGFNQELMKEIFEILEIDYNLAKNGLEAFEKFKANKYDLVLMDQNMPIMGGIESTRNIREYEKENSLPYTTIVALSANALKGDREKFIEAGMNDHLSKPLDIKKLQELINSLIGS